MKSDTKKWKKNFYQQLVHIQIKFDAFFAEGRMYDYYTLKEDKKRSV